MGRIRENITVKGKNCWTLFDSGSRNTYITKNVAVNLQISDLQKPRPVSLGGKIHNVVKECILTCVIEGFDISTYTMVLEDIGIDEDGKEIEVLFGALAMQQWGIKLDLEREKLDMSNYPKEFVEF
jgi:hypothetical protein